jgi:hypothetical protein
LNLNSSRRNSRVDVSGRAFAGSQRWLQSLVNSAEGSPLSRLIRESCGGLIEQIEWTSPLAEKGFQEYRDQKFLSAIGYPSLSAALYEFWPRRGPHWDALARARLCPASASRGVLLVEAKSYPGEVVGNGCQASPASRAQIERALTGAKSWFQVEPSADWLGPLYQSANRLAHLYFLRQIAQIPAWLINIYFVNDPRTPTSRAEWERDILATNACLGFTQVAPFVLSVFPEAREI